MEDFQSIKAMVEKLGFSNTTIVNCVYEEKEYKSHKFKIIQR